MFLDDLTWPQLTSCWQSLVWHKQKELQSFTYTRLCWDIRFWKIQVLAMSLIRWKASTNSNFFKSFTRNPSRIPPSLKMKSKHLIISGERYFTLFIKIEHSSSRLGSRKWLTHCSHVIWSLIIIPQQQLEKYCCSNASLQVSSWLVVTFPGSSWGTISSNHIYYRF